MSELTTTHYSVQVGDLWVSIDLEALALSVKKPGLAVVTEDLGSGVLIDRDLEGRIVAVEMIAAHGQHTKEGT